MLSEETIFNNQTNNPMQIDELLLDQFQQAIEERHLVPVIGTGAYYADMGAEGHWPVIRYLALELLMKYRYRLVRPGENFESIKEYVLNLSKSQFLCMSWFESRLGGAFKTALVKLLRDNEFLRIIELEPKISAFLELGNFPLLVSTSLISHKLMSLVCARKNYLCRKYSLLRKADDDIELDSNYDNIKQSTLYFLFGQATNAYSPFVSTEIDLIQYLHALQDSSTRPAQLLDYISKRQILTLGCEIPDWTFRLLLFSLNPGSVSISYAANSVSGGVLQRFDTNCKDFLSRINYYANDSFNDFLIPICQRLSVQHTTKQKIFLSYSAEENSDDFRRIQELAMSLRDKFEVFFFPNNKAAYPGGQYWYDIENAINECDCFMPVLTKDFLLRINDEKEVNQDYSAFSELKDKESGYLTEWRMAVARYNRILESRQGNTNFIFSIPYCLDVVEARVNGPVKSKLLFANNLFYPPNGTTFANSENFNIEKLYQILTDEQQQ